MNRNNKISTIISSILVLLLFLGGFGLIFQFTNGFQEEFKTFYVTYEGKGIYATESKILLSYEQDQRFDVVYTFEFLDEGEETNTDYSVKIVPNADEDFTFTVDGEEVKYSSVGELSSVFNLKKYDTYFTVDVPSDVRIESVLETLYGKDVEIPSDGANGITHPYTLVVSSYDESVTYYIDLEFGGKITGIDLTPNKVVL